MRYKILEELREISKARETIRLGELIKRLNQARDDYTVLDVSRAFRTSERYSLEILDHNVDRYDAVKVKIVILASEGNVPINANTQFYVVCVFCRHNDRRYGFDNWSLEDDNGVTYNQLENEYLKSKSFTQKRKTKYKTYKKYTW